LDGSGWARGEAQVVGRWEAEGAAEGAQEAAGLGRFGGEGAGFRLGEEDLDLAGELGGALVEADEPRHAAAEQVGARGGLRARRLRARGAGLADAAGAGLGQGSGVPAQGEGVEAVGEAPEAAMGEDEEGDEGRGHRADDRRLPGHEVAQPREGAAEGPSERALGDDD